MTVPLSLTKGHLNSENAELPPCQKLKVSVYNSVFIIRLLGHLNVQFNALQKGTRDWGVRGILFAMGMLIFSNLSL